MNDQMMMETIVSADSLTAHQSCSSSIIARQQRIHHHDCSRQYYAHIPCTDAPTKQQIYRHDQWNFSLCDLTTT
jgi:hypothetical protein